jgi:hypothetical protein
VLDSLITSKTRIRLLIKFFSNPETKSYLREIAEEFGESTNAVRVELNRLSDAQLLNSKPKGRTVQYAANTEHPLFTDISRIVSKYLGLDKIAVNIARRLGDIEMAFVIGDYARGIDSGIIDLVIVGDEVDSNLLSELSAKVEELIKRKIRTLVLGTEEYGEIARQASAGAAAQKQFRNPIMVYVAGEQPS